MTKASFTKIMISMAKTPGKTFHPKMRFRTFSSILPKAASKEILAEVFTC